MSAGIRTSSSSTLVRKVDDFIVGFNIAKSNFSSVYAGFHKATKQKVAVKMISKRKMLKYEHHNSVIFAETKLYPYLIHPNITRVLKCFENISSYFQVLEFHSNDLLSYLINKKPTYEEKIEIVKQILSAVNYLHTHNLCHRDIKLDNILIDDEGNAYLSDFGFAAFTTSPNTGFFGSDGYAAPEVISGRHAEYDGAAADLWSLGVLIYALFARKLPFERTRDTSKLDPTKIDYSSLTPEIENIVRNLIVVDPKGRMPISSILYEEVFAPYEDENIDYTNIPDYQDKKTKEMVSEVFNIKNIEEKLEESGMNPEKSMYQIINEQISKETSEPFMIPLSLPIIELNEQEILCTNEMYYNGCLLDAINTTRDFFIKKNFCVSTSSDGNISIIRNHIEKDISINIRLSYVDENKTLISIEGNDSKEVEAISCELEDIQK